jgi:hypothetical protein
LRFLETHGKGNKKKSVSPSVLTGLAGVGKKIICRALETTHGKLKGLPFVPQKTHGKTIFYRALFICRAPCIKRTAKKLSTVRPKENARQRFSRTANSGFPVVSVHKLGR